MVAMDDRCWLVFGRNALTPLSPIEELGLVAKTYKNPVLEVGDRIRSKRKGMEKRTGTITSVAEGGWCRVHWDGREEDNQNWLIHNLELIPPMEALASVAKTYKNPKINVGDRVCRSFGPYKSRVGTVTGRRPEISLTGPYMTVFVLFDGSEYPQQLIEEHLKTVTPIEELALAHALKPRTPR
jgi:hypothetical protein